MAEEETRFYDFDNMPAFVKGGAFRLVTPAGEKRIEDIARFLQDAQPISKEQFDRLCAGGRADAGESKKAGLEPLKDEKADAVPGPGLDTVVIDDIIANPGKYRKQWAEDTQHQYPGKYTQEQLDASWDQLAHQVGLPTAKELDAR
jgi:hypothetical protein